MLEDWLSKERILEIYLNHVESGEGVFGAKATAHSHLHAEATLLEHIQVARLPVMLRVPKRFEKTPTSGDIVGRAAAVASHMPAVDPS